MNDEHWVRQSSIIAPLDDWLEKDESDQSIT